MASMDIVNNQNVVERIVHLPLVISTYDLVSNVYCNTKNNHPYLKSVCEVAENGVKSITSAAFHSALPIIGKLEPQISMANDLACKGLDKIERTLPILHKPSDQVLCNICLNVKVGMKRKLQSSFLPYCDVYSSGT
uniref:Perilipin 1 n=1 Tax=Sinocyclocheilus grahami TaxID=75366 RepID=A0A672KP80_SINGR